MALSVVRGGSRGALKGKSGVKWIYDTLTPNLIAFGPALTEVVLPRALDSVAEDMQTFMQQNAPWQDETGSARAGLKAERFGTGTKQGINLYHSVSYGIWLEVRWNGAYAIILPTIQMYDPMQGVANIIKRDMQGAL